MSSTRKKVSAIEKLISRNEQLEARCVRAEKALRDIKNYRGAAFVGKEPPDREMRKIAKAYFERRGNTP